MAGQRAILALGRRQGNNRKTRPFYDNDDTE